MVEEGVGFWGVEQDLRPLVFGAMVECWRRDVNGDGELRGLCECNSTLGAEFEGEDQRWRGL